MIASAGISILILWASLSMCAHGTQVKQCPGRPQIPTGEVTINTCSGPPCALKKNTSPEMSILFTPKKNIPMLMTKVAGIISSISFPFIGVDSTDACPDIYTSDGTEKHGCPLKAGTQYSYKTRLQVLRSYPTTFVVVQWALHDPQNNTDVACFQLASRIVN